MDQKRSFLNVFVSIAFKILLLIGNLLVRRYLIAYIGDEVNGINSLFISIVDFLSVTELGVGTAITFCMYKPIVDGENEKVSALYGLFQRLYIIIGAIILVGGCAVMPFLPYLAKDYDAAGINLYFCFALMLVSVILTYLFSAKTSLINAYKDNYITTTITSGCQLVQLGTQIAVLLVSGSFVWFLVCRILCALLQWGITEIVARKKYASIISGKHYVDDLTKRQVVRNVRAMFMHKIGNVLVNSADSIIISAFLGVVVLGKYANYSTIMTAMTGTISLFFTPLTSIIGHLYAEGHVESLRKYFNFFHTLNFIIGTIFFLGYYGIIDNLVTIFFDKGMNGSLEMAKSVSFVITLNYFVQFMRQATMLFRDATGTFYFDRWKAFVEGILNVVLSVAFVLWLGVVGVILATIVTNLFICHPVEPLMLYRHALRAPIRSYYVRNYLYIAAFCGALFLLHFAMQYTGAMGGSLQAEVTELLKNGFLAVGVALIPCSIAIAADKDFRHYVVIAFSKLRQRFRKEKQK